MAAEQELVGTVVGVEPSLDSFFLKPTACILEHNHILIGEYIKDEEKLDIYLKSPNPLF